MGMVSGGDVYFYFSRNTKGSALCYAASFPRSPVTLLRSSVTLPMLMDATRDAPINTIKPYIIIGIGLYPKLGILLMNTKEK